MADSRMREDVESAYLDITEFTGQSLTGPRELITRRVLCSNPVQTMTDTQAGQIGDAGESTGRGQEPARGHECHGPGGRIVGLGEG